MRNLRTKQMNMGREQKGKPENGLLTAENKVRVTGGEVGTGTGSACDGVKEGTCVMSSGGSMAVWAH